MHATEDLRSCPVHSPLPTAPNGCPVSLRAARFDPFDPQHLQSPGKQLRWAREQEPVFWSPKLRHWVVTRHEDVKAVLRDQQLYSPANVLEKVTPATPEVMRLLQRAGFDVNRTLVNEEEPEHMRHRRLLMEPFLPARLARFEPLVRQWVQQALDAIAGRGRADLVAELFHPIPLKVALSFLGVPQESAQALCQLKLAHTLNTWGRPTPAEQAEHARQLGEFWRLSQDILDEMMARPDGEGFMYEAIAQHRLHPQEVTLSYLRSLIMAILSAAHESTALALGNALHTLLQDGQAWAEVCRHPAVIPNAVEECLRVAGSVSAWRRRTTQETLLGGVRLPKGGRLLVVLASANVDALHFERPEAVDVYREDAIEHLTFGYGAHQCMGKNLARLQMRVVIEELARRLPHLRLADRSLEYLPNIAFRGPRALWVEWDTARMPVWPTDPGPGAGQPFWIGPPKKESLARPLVLRDREEPVPGIVRLRLADPEGRDLPAWTAGAHVDLISGGHRRKYSLCGDPDDRQQWELLVQREARGRGGSVHFCDQLRVGDVLAFSGPRNLFTLDEDAAHCVLIAGGIGITPILAMADRLRRLGRSYELHYAGRARAQMALLPRIERDHAAGLSVYAKDEARRLSLPTLAGRVRAGWRVYACGPQRLIDELERLGSAWPEGTLRFEHFHSHSPAAAQAEDRAFEVELRDSQVQLRVGAGQSLLEVLQAAGFDVPRDCGEGLCGACEVRVIEGEVDHRDGVLGKAERAAHERMLSCCSRAAGTRLVLGL